MNEQDDGPDLDDLRQLMHERVDAVFDQVKGPLGIEGAALQLCAQLLKAAGPFIDRHVGRELSALALRSPDEVLKIGQEHRKRMKAARYLVDGETPTSTAREGLIGTSIIIGQLGAAGDDPYLYQLSQALQLHRHGQHHPWLAPQPAVARPAQHAHGILMLRAVPFTAIEYLAASGAYPTKTDARDAVIPILGIEENTLADWRKQQNRKRRGDFDIALYLSRRMGTDIRDRRKQWPGQSWVEDYARYQDSLNGLPAVERAAAILRAIGALRPLSGDASGGGQSGDLST
jgi:hypothetical protein